MADQITTMSRLAYQEADWYSSHRKKQIHLGGYTGKLVFQGELTPFIPILAAGFLLGVGKKTGYGLGRFDTAAWRQAVTVDDMNQPGASFTA